MIKQVHKSTIWHNPTPRNRINLKSIIGSRVYLYYVPKELNENADSLAKDGLDKDYLYTYWANNPFQLSTGST